MGKFSLDTLSGKSIGFLVGANAVGEYYFWEFLVSRIPGNITN